MRSWSLQLSKWLSLVIAVSWAFSGVAGEAAAASSSKTVVYVNGQRVSDSDVSIVKGSIFIPFKLMTKQLGMPVKYQKLDELYIYHQYTIDTGDREVIMWGESRLGYNLNEKDEDLTVIYRAEKNCMPESDVCTMDTKNYSGPRMIDKQLAVPVRLMAKALELELSVKEEKGVKVVRITN